MGAGISSSREASAGGGLKPGLGDVPESCVASVFVHLSPLEICRLAKLNRTFRGAASADFVWELKLPENYRYLVQKLFGEIPENWAKKEIYARLCRPNPFDGGTKEVWLEKRTGRACMSISSKGLSITGIDDRRYWNFIPTEESRACTCGSGPLIETSSGPEDPPSDCSVKEYSVPNVGTLASPRFPVVAYLQQIWWFEVDGEVEFQFPVGTYSLFFRLQLGRASKRFGRRICNSDHVHGWDIKPVRFQLSTSDGQHSQCECYLGEPGRWIHCHVGDFSVENSNTLMKVKFSMTQIDCTHTKGGLCVDSVLICPSEFKERRKLL